MPRDPDRIGQVVDRLRQASAARPAAALCEVVCEAVSAPASCAVAGVTDVRLTEGLKRCFGPVAGAAAGREGLLSVLAWAWSHVTDWRFCQLLCNLAELHEVPEVFHVEDDALARGLEAVVARAGASR